MIFNAVDLKKFSPQDPKIKKTEKIVGGVFRLKEVKRPLLWLEVAELYPRKFRRQGSFHYFRRWAYVGYLQENGSKKKDFQTR